VFLFGGFGSSGRLSDTWFYGLTSAATTTRYGSGCPVLGPAPAPLAVLRGQHRRRLLMKAALDVNVQATLRHWLSKVRVPSRLRVQVDVDPYSFM